tara:strand:+ start:1520 stop:1780 length:261 start_codon:yes stop_codon:yes gene_type:complete
MLSLFICGYSEDNLKCSIKEDKEIFNLLKDYDRYTDVVKYNDLPVMRRKLITILNRSVSENIKENIKEIINVINKAQKDKKGVYWY